MARSHEVTLLDQPHCFISFIHLSLDDKDVKILKSGIAKMIRTVNSEHTEKLDPCFKNS
jgi:hypothetical protein